MMATMPHEGPARPKRSTAQQPGAFAHLVSDSMLAAEGGAGARSPQAGSRVFRSIIGLQGHSSVTGLYSSNVEAEFGHI